MSPAPTQRLSFVISTLEGGGGARAMCNLANQFAELGRQVSLISLTVESTDFYSVHPAIKRIGLGVSGLSRHPLDAFLANFRRGRALRRALQDTEPEAIVAFMDRSNIITVIAAVGLGVPVIVCEQIDPRAYPIPPVWAFLRLVTYRLADAVVVLSPQQVPWAARRWGSKRMRVIPNAAPPPGTLPPEGRQESVAEPPRRGEEEPTWRSAGIKRMNRKILLGIGRLDSQKGFDLLMNVFARLAVRHGEWDLVILGEGPERPSLETLRRELDIEGRVRLPGHVADVGAWLGRADLFVLSSRFEGFPNVLLEAMAAGLAVVSFDCPTGPSEIIRDQVDGLLVPPEDIGGLEAALEELMTDEQRRNQLGMKATEGVERFSLDTIVRLWDRLFDELTRA